MRTSVSDSRAVNPTPCSASSPLGPKPLPRPRASSKPNRQSTKPIGKSTVPPPPTLPRVDVPPRAPLQQPTPSHQLGSSTDSVTRRLLPRKSFSLLFQNTSEQRMLAQQRRENAQQRCSKWTGYTRGPQMLKAVAELHLKADAKLKADRIHDDARHSIWNYYSDLRGAYRLCTTTRERHLI